MSEPADNLCESRQALKLAGLKPFQPLVGERAELFAVLMATLPEDGNFEDDPDDLGAYATAYILTAPIERLRRMADGDPGALVKSAQETIKPKVRFNEETERALTIVCVDAIRQAAQAIELKRAKALADGLRGLREAEATLARALKELEEAGAESEPGQPSA